MRRRLILGAAYLLLVVVVSLTVPFALVIRRQLVDQLGVRVEREAYAVGGAVEDLLEDGTPDPIQPLVERLAEDIGGRVLVTDAAGVLLADSLDPPGLDPPSYASRPEIAAALRGEPGWQVRHSDTLGEDLLVSAVPVTTSDRLLGAVRISYPMSAVSASIRRSQWFLAGVGLATLLIGLLLAAWLARWMARPVRLTASVARRIGAGDLHARAPEIGPPEVRELARDLNAMTARLSDLMRSNREFAASASHQLRTPLAALQLSLEEALVTDRPDEEIRHALAETARLTAIVESLLALGRSRETASGLVELRPLADELVAERYLGQPGVLVRGLGRASVDRERVRQALTNLLDNARRFARTRIVLDLRQEGELAMIRVLDDGPGVAPEERERIFDRFFRGRDPRGAGSGLGLAVARELVAADGGTIRVVAGDLGGAGFEIVYPASDRRTAGVPA